jgi:hypothetical protein
MQLAASIFIAVNRLVRDHELASSNLLAPIINHYLQAICEDARVLSRTVRSLCHALLARDKLHRNELFSHLKAHGHKPRALELRARSTTLPRSQ